MSLEESNKMSKKIPSQDSNSEEIEWDFEEMKKRIGQIICLKMEV